MAVHPLRTISIKLALKKAYGHPRFRGIVPLKEIRRATVLMDGTMEDAAQTRKDIDSFFGKRGIPVTIISVTKSDTNLLGRLRKKVRHPDGVERDENLFISLIRPDSAFAFASEYEAVCSPAAFKVARWQTGKEEIIDFTVLPSEESGTDAATQRKVFLTITEYLNIIR